MRGGATLIVIFFSMCLCLRCDALCLPASQLWMLRRCCMCATQLSRVFGMHGIVLYIIGIGMLSSATAPALYLMQSFLYIVAGSAFFKVMVCHMPFTFQFPKPVSQPISRPASHPASAIPIPSHPCPQHLDLPPHPPHPPQSHLPHPLIRLILSISFLIIAIFFSILRFILILQTLLERLVHPRLVPSEAFWQASFGGL